MIERQLRREFKAPHREILSQSYLLLTLFVKLAEKKKNYYLEIAFEIQFGRLQGLRVKGI